MQSLQTVQLCPQLLSVFITNLGKYNEGELIGQWLDLPVTQDKLQQVLVQIGIDDAYYQEYFLTDYESPIEGLIKYIDEYSNINILNKLAKKLNELTTDELALYEAVIEFDNGITEFNDLISLIDKLDEYQLLTGVHNEYDLGYYWIEESGCYDLNSLGNLASYIDYERFGRDIALEQDGEFTANGYVYR